MLLRTLKIRWQIMTVPALSAIVVAAVALFAAISIEDRIDAAHRLQIQSVVEATMRIVAEYRDDAARGRRSEAEAKDLARQTIRSVRFAGNEYLYAYDYDGILVAHPFQTKLEGTDELIRGSNGSASAVRDLIAAARAGGGFVKFEWPKPGETAPSPKLGYGAPFEPWKWMIGGGVYIDDMAAERTRAATRVAAVGAGSLAFVCLLGFVVARSIARRVREQARRMARLADGNMDEVVEDEGADEIGEMARALEVFRSRMIENREMATARENEQRARAEEGERVASIARAFNLAAKTALDEVGQAASAMETTAGELSGAVVVVSDRSSVVAESAREASEGMESVAASTAELARSVDEIAGRIQSSARVADEAADETTRAAAKVEGLAKAVREIDEVVALIRDIASQTNMLALNATIEAARAGEAGKGFAVVAQEVKNLAGQTARATGEISERIQTIQAAAGEATGSVDHIASIISAIRDTTTAIAAAAEQQGETTRAIDEAVRRVSDDTVRVGEAITEVAATTEQTRGAAGDSLDASRRLTKQCDALRREIHRFLDDLRVA